MRRQMPTHTKTLGSLSAGERAFSIGTLRCDGEQAAPAQAETTMMSMMKMAIHAATTAKVVFTTITALISAAAPAGVESPVIPTLRAATPAELQWKGNRIAGKAYPVGQISPQYLPPLAQARSLRLRAVHRPMATPVEVKSLSELRWRRFVRLRSIK